MAVNESDPESQLSRGADKRDQVPSDHVLTHRIRKYLRRLPATPDELDDLVQEVLARWWCERAERLPRQGDAAFPIDICRAVSADWARNVRRAMARRQRLVTEPIVERHEAAEEEEERRICLLADWIDGLVLQLPPRRREAVWRRVVLGQSAKEAAAAMGCSPSAVWAHASYGLRQLRELAEKQPPPSTATLD